ncbi:L,D-transpeptidase [Streptomyces albicerus]|uniref:L,D-transpeptidase n=1 Tax=Streptomyces albicerus TaxID=2569859 RepID=UPI001788B799|nr:L,D-transpeptidase [Streptomyces albicerus]
MSDELTPRRPEDASGSGQLDRSELALALHELAQDHETPVPVPGAEIRRRAVRRRRRRQGSLAAAGATAAGALALVLTVILTGGEDARSTPPAATYGAPTPPVTRAPSPVAPAVTVDLTRRELTVEGRILPISSGALKTPTPTGLMTVTAKYPAATVPGDSAGFNGYDMKATWVMRLRTPDDRTNYVLALTWDEKAPGNYDSTGGVIGLRSPDAMLLYKVLKPGSVVEVVGAAPATELAPTGKAKATAAEPSTATDAASPAEPRTAATRGVSGGGTGP